MSKHIERESKTYEDGSKTVEDVFVKKDGTLFVNTYNITSDGKRHDHSAVDENGKYLGGHKEETRPWKNRYFGLQYLSTLSFVELQMIEAKSTNEYVRQSARHFMQFSSRDINTLTPEHNKVLVKSRFK
ncbi:MAG: hypothetical protein PHP12_02380 [Bacilli bacterium]|nr:hypothetical protein [Bacilli bacterium]